MHTCIHRYVQKTQTYMPTCIQTYRHTHIHTNIHTDTHRHTHTYIPRYIHTVGPLWPIQLSIYTRYRHTYKHRAIDTNTHRHTHIHTSIPPWRRSKIRRRPIDTTWYELGHASSSLFSAWEALRPPPAPPPAFLCHIMHACGPQTYTHIHTYILGHAARSGEDT